MRYSSRISRYIATTPDWLVRLQEDYRINAIGDGDLVSLKYDQIESPMYEQIVQECRGLVVHIPTGKILAHPYNKFWNHGDTLATPIDWSTARVLEKLDGSLMTLYWHEERWNVASSGTPRAGGQIGDVEGMTFRDLFWQTFCALGMQQPEQCDASVCFMFELCTAENRIVVRHDKPRIVLHGARDMTNGTELDRDQLASYADEYKWEVVRSYPISSIEDCLHAAEQVDPIECEGFIVVDAAFNRVKIKSPRYVILHHMKGAATPRRAIELWQTGEAGELLSHFPEMALQILPIHERLDRLAEIAVDDVVANSDAPDRKAFAMAIKTKPWSAVAFKLYGASNTNVDAAKAIMRASSLAALERMLESDGAA